MIRNIFTGFIIGIAVTFIWKYLFEYIMKAQNYYGSILPKNIDYEYNLHSDYPTHWQRWGVNESRYIIGAIDGLHGKAMFAKTRENINFEKYPSFLGLGQSIGATSFIGKRVRFSGKIKSNSVGLIRSYIRLDSLRNIPLWEANDPNFHHGYIEKRKHQNWQDFQIVVDVPKGIETIRYGIIGFANIEAIFDDFNFEIVDKNTPLSENEGYSFSKNSHQILEKPTNLNFDSIVHLEEYDKIFYK
jgi:hypothetical protein